ncbi:MAG: tetratricopeptide repeat protein [Candidatus Sumerlaeia bacterium]|nr:tetratricopeptide repeat protein [Candidatus Sumerlaeia bacterium]
MLFCPVCHAELRPDFPGECDVCGAQVEPGSEVLDERPDPPASDLPAQDVDEVLVAFRRQFEERRLEPPKGWTDRLAELARRTETSRRLATVVFMDLRGSTRLNRLLPEEQALELVHWFYGVCTRHIERHGGFVIKPKGDGVLAAFGAPWAFERDAEGALLCLLDIVEEVRARGAWQGHELAVRAGATNGVLNVVFAEVGGTRVPDVLGSTVDLASRLEERAATWEILIPGEFAELVGGAFVLEPREPFVPKGFDATVRPFAVLAHRGKEATRRRDAAAFVGRQAEMDAVAAWFARAAAGGFVAARVQGPAGIGKSRLVAQVLDTRCPEGIDVLRVPIEPHERHVLLAPVLFALRSLLTEQGRELSAVLEGLTDALPGLDRAVVPALGYVLGVEPHLSTMRTLAPKAVRLAVEAAVVSLLACRAARAPLALVLDDVQWCDPLSLALVRALAERRPPGLMLLLVGRLEDEDPTDAFGGTAAPSPLAEFPAESLALAPLDGAERVELLRCLVDPDLLHPLLRQRLLDETEGIPLYLIESALEASAASTHVESEALARALVEGAPLERQRRLIDIFQARLDRLTATRRAVLQCGAVLGRRFSYAVLSAYDEIREHLIDELLALKGVRMLREEAGAGDVEFLFTPSLLRDAAYQMLTAEQRRRLHGRFADILRRRFPERREELAVEIVAHQVRAGQLAEARRGIRAVCMRARRLGMPQESLDMALRLIELSQSELGSERGTSLGVDKTMLQQMGLLHEQAGRAARLLGDYAGALEHFDHWRELARRAGNTGWVANAELETAITLFEKGENDRADALLDGLLARESLPRAKRRELQRTRGGLLFRRARFEEALACFREVAEADGARATALHADGWSSVGLCLWQLGRLDEAATAIARAHEVYAANSAPYGEALALNNLGIVLEKLGRFDEAADVYARAHATAEQCGYLHALSAIAANRANVAYLFEDYEPAARESARALHLAQLIGHAHSEVVARINLGMARGGLGLFDEARGDLDAAEALATRTGDTGNAANARLEIVWVEMQANRLGEARRVLDGTAVPAGAEEADWQRVLGWALEVAERRDAPMELPADLLTPETARSVVQRANRVAQWLRARLA